MSVPSYKAVVRHLESKPAELQQYFDPLPSLIEKYPWEVSVAYVFSRIEKGQHRALYCGAVKLHSAHTEVAWGMLESKHFTRDGFQERFAVVFGELIPAPVIAKIKNAETARDRVMHGKHVRDDEMRSAIVDAIEYAHGLNDFLQEHAGLKPFGKLQGFKGRGQSLEKETTRWLLKGMGF